MAPATLGQEISRIRSIFRFAASERLVRRPVQFGVGWRSPSAKVLLQARYAKGSRMFEADEIRKLIDAANPQMAAMIHLGMNCGFGPHDIGALPESAVDMESGWCTHPRPKTGVYRGAPPWPETVTAPRSSLSHRPVARRGDPRRQELLCLFYFVAGKQPCPDVIRHGNESLVADPLAVDARHIITCMPRVMVDGNPVGALSADRREYMAQGVEPHPLPRNLPRDK